MATKSPTIRDRTSKKISALKARNENKLEEYIEKNEH